MAGHTLGIFSLPLCMAVDCFSRNNLLGFFLNRHIHQASQCVMDEYN